MARTRTELLSTGDRTGRIETASKIPEISTVDYLCELEMRAADIGSTSTEIKIEITGRFGLEDRLIVSADWVGGSLNHVGNPVGVFVSAKFRSGRTQPDFVFCVIDSQEEFRYSCILDEGDS